MATKTKAKKEQMYFLPKLYLEDYPACCGSAVLTGLSLDEFTPTPKPQRASWWNDAEYKWHLDEWKAEKSEGRTKEECYRHLLKYIQDHRDCRHIQMTFVKRRKGQRTGDMPNDFKDFLEKNGWYCIDEFVNPNHGNLLCVMGKTFRSKPKNTKTQNHDGWW